jgi:hypothetical protein
MIPNEPELRRRVIANMITYCEGVPHLTDWETQFIESMKARVKDGQDLTNTMADKLEQIFDKN